MRNAPGPTPPGDPEREIRRPIKCRDCGRMARWTGSVYECPRGHENDE